MSAPNRLRARAGLLVALAGLGLAAPVALGSVRQDVVAPPGVTGRAQQPTASEQFPGAGLPATMRYRPRSARVRGRLDRPTQATKATVHAYLSGRAPRRRQRQRLHLHNARAQPPLRVQRRPPHVRRPARRHDNTVRLTVVMRMVNADGRRTTLKRVVTVRPE